VPSAPLRRVAIAAIAAAGLVAMSGCALTSPAIITKPYVAADGTNADLELPDGKKIFLRNFVVVLPKAGGTGQVIGAIGYSGEGTLPLKLEAKNAAQLTVAEPTKDEAAQGGNPEPVGPSVVLEVTGGRLSQVGPTGTPFVLPGVIVGPGQYVDLTATSPATGSVTWQVPVVAAVGYYAGLTATAAPSPTATAGESPTTTTTAAETTTSSP
jgi:hypothetical protein